MTTLKKMTGTKSFKRLPDHQRKCLVQAREECQTEHYLNQVKIECKCTPWALQTNKVGKKCLENKIFSSRQESIACGPEKEHCVKNQTLKDKNCLVSCEGLYADISDDSLKQNIAIGKCKPKKSSAGLKILNTLFTLFVVNEFLLQILALSCVNFSTEHVLV